MSIQRNGSLISIGDSFKFFSNRSLTSVAALVLLGCNHPSFPEGTFQGNLLQKSDQGTTQELITADVSPMRKGHGDIVIRDAKTASESNTLQVTLSNNGKVTLTLPGVLQNPVELEKMDDCYHSSGEPDVSFCETSTEFSIEVDDQGNPVFKLSASQFDLQGVYQFETPKSYDLKDAMQIALTKNFGSRIEFERVMEAKSRAKSAYLNLLPHINLSDILSNLTPNVASVMGVIGDLCPFLLPSRWIAAKDASITSQAEQDAMILMQFDTAAQLEALTYSYTQDKGIVSLYNYLIARAQSARDASWKIESEGTFPKGSTAHLDADIISMKLDLSAYSQLLEQDRAAIAQAMGLNNPAGVTEIIFDDSTDWSSIKPLDAQELSQIAIDRAFELQQIDELIQIAKNQKKATVFNWLDPYGDPAQDLGFNLSENLAVDADQVNELGIRKQDLEAGIVRNLFSTVEQYNKKAGDYPTALSSVQLSEQRLNTVVGQLTPNSGLNTLDIEAIFQDYLATGIRKETTLSSLRIAKAEVDRRLLQGFYSRF
jgi:hypothetical protein